MGCLAGFRIRLRAGEIDRDGEDAMAASIGAEERLSS